jgi:maleate cis-trans isomerase
MNGWRKRIGYISSSVHETTMHDFFQYKLEGVGIVGITSNISGWIKGDFEGAMSRVVEDARSLAKRKVDYIIYAGTPLLVSRGKGSDVELIRKIREATGVNATTSISAEMAAFQHFGAKRIAVASPYPADVQRNTLEFLRAHGYEIVKEATMDVGFHVLQDIPPFEIYRFGRDVLQSALEADLLYMPCPQWQVQSAVGAIERDTRKPVVAGDPAKFWSALQSIGIHDRIEGCGMLLRSLSEQDVTSALNRTDVRLAS